MAAHTKLKFRQPGQTSTTEVKRRDLRAELLVAEQEARNKKRKAQGLPIEDIPTPAAGQLAITAGDEEESNKRRKLLQEVIDLDKDDDDSDEDEQGAGAPAGGMDKGKGRADDADSDADDDDDDDDDSDEDETAELLRELEKIKRERAEEKARQDQEEQAKSAEDRAAEVAMGNPLLNLAAALGQQTPNTPTSASVGGSFAVKKRWDDDLVFKNQAQTEPARPTHFVNDLLRTEFHKKFMSKFIK